MNMTDMKERMTEKALALLQDAGFQTSDCRMVRSCFDILARRDETILLIKVHVNIEGLTSKSAAELRNVAAAMSATPLIIGDHMKCALLSPDVIYTRYDIHVLNIEAFAEILRHEIPLIYSIRGNYCMRINPQLLTEVRKKANITQEDLASEIGVSKQSIHRYESTGRISLDIAEKLMDFLKQDMAVPGQIFSSEIRYLESEISMHMTELKRIAFRELRNMGLDPSLTNAPFDILAVEKEHDQKILTLVTDDLKGLHRRVEIIKDISEMTGYRRVCISNRAHGVDVVVIRPKELSEIKEADELFRLLDE